MSNQQPDSPPPSPGTSRRAGLAAMGLFALLLAGAVGWSVASGDGEPVIAASNDTAEPATATATTQTILSEAPEVLRPRPELLENDGWLQSPYSSLEELDGQVYIVEFWTFGCFNCRAVKPHLRAIYDTYRDDGLEIIGIHAPEFEFEKDVEAIKQAAADQNVNWPIVLDTNKKSFRHWQEDRRFWPRTYVVDQNGDIRYDHIGEGAYDELEATVAWLLENGA